MKSKPVIKEILFFANGNHPLPESCPQLNTYYYIETRSTSDGGLLRFVSLGEEVTRTFEIIVNPLAEGIEMI